MTRPIRAPNPSEAWSKYHPNLLSTICGVFMYFLDLFTNIIAFIGCRPQAVENCATAQGAG